MGLLQFNKVKEPTVIKSKAKLPNSPKMVFKNIIF